MPGPNSQGPGPQNLTANSLKSATTVVSVSSATAPTSGQVLTATGGTAATWQTPSGGNTGTIGNLLLSSTEVNLNEGTAAKQALYTCPANRRAVITNVVIQKFSSSVTSAQAIVGWNAGADDVARFEVATNQFTTGRSVNAATPVAPDTTNYLKSTPAIGTAADVLGLIVTTPEGSALTARVDLFGYLTDTSGVPVANVLIP